MSDPTIQLIELVHIHPDPENSRSDLQLDDEFIASIATHGVLQPIRVRAIGTNGDYQLIAGHRRHGGATLAGLVTIPAIVTDADDATAAAEQIVENLQRTDLTHIEIAKGIQRLHNLGINQQTIATQIGMTGSNVSRHLALLRLPEFVQDQVAKGRIDYQSAALMVGLDEGIQAELVTQGNINSTSIGMAKEKEANTNLLLDGIVALEAAGGVNVAHDDYSDTLVLRTKSAPAAVREARKGERRYVTTMLGYGKGKEAGTRLVEYVVYEPTARRKADMSPEELERYEATRRERKLDKAFKEAWISQVVSLVGHIKVTALLPMMLEFLIRAPKSVQRDALVYLWIEIVEEGMTEETRLREHANSSDRNLVRTVAALLMAHAGQPGNAWVEALLVEAGTMTVAETKAKVKADFEAEEAERNKEAQAKADKPARTRPKSALQANYDAGQEDAETVEEEGPEG